MDLRFRKIDGDQDLQMILAWRTLPEVTAHMYTDLEHDMVKHRAWFERANADPTRRDWIIVADGEDVGLVSLYRIDQVNRRCDWAYYLGSTAVRGKGIGKSIEMNVLDYVFGQLGLNKLCCEVLVANQLVIEIHQKYGSRVEGTRRQHICKNGQYLDIVEMAILRSEWEQNVKGKFAYAVAEIEA